MDLHNDNVDAPDVGQWDKKCNRTWATSGLVIRRIHHFATFESRAVRAEAIVFLTVCCLVVVRGQFFDGFDSSFRGFGGGLDSPLQATRDPRQNPGPVVFPPAPPDNGETSGVVVGASGYGFVPPGSNGGSRRSF
ncbi:hypothetical protein Zmor_000516 [Zophobas morio]|uniref:Uncharacterized protein n=1 Tax=Zophobas morio TaxID=2755281 RepID=A0AA38J2W8_9CUCU|nr:hypothetical protein Zmor_000516 [Zophobas morio]